MIGIKSIASYVPAGGIDNYAQGAKFSKDEEFILGKIGSAFLPRKDADQETSDLCVEAVNALFANNPQLKRESIDALIVVTKTATPKACRTQPPSFRTNSVCRPTSQRSTSPWAARATSTASTR
jgi:3-oxoacyl-[acyl-carrier-protein] synthase III